MVLMNASSFLINLEKWSNKKMNKIRYVFLACIFCSSVEAVETSLTSQTYDINSISFVEKVAAGGAISISAVLNTGEIKGKILIPDICEPEGGNPQIVHTFKKSHSQSNGGILALTCKYFINHSGLGIKGNLYQAKIYEINENDFLELRPLEKELSGYEGSSESGLYSYYFYTSKDSFSQKLNLLLDGQKSDSLTLAHAIAMERLATGDSDAIASYLSEDKINELIAIYPITPARAAPYNDIGFALAESGKNEEALSLLLSIEKVTPNRTVLLLNIADAYWPSDKTKAKEYYLRYYGSMIAVGKEKLIPPRVYERSNH